MTTNAYESGEQKIIPAVLLYAFYQDKILMLHSRGKEGVSPKWNGLGGKLEQGETMSEATVREFHEEALCVTSPKQWTCLGQLYFPNFKAHKREDWWVNVLVTELTEMQANSLPLDRLDLAEGTLHWISREEILKLELWDGDCHFLPYVLKKQAFYGTFFYENGSCVRHELTSFNASNQ